MLFQILAVVVGLFYAVGGLLILRHLPPTGALDSGLAELPAAEANRLRGLGRLNRLAAVLLAASGLSLVLLSSWSPALFLCSALVHGLQLYWTWRIAAEADAETRSRVHANLRALAFYLCAFAFVIYLDRTGIWRHWLEPSVLEPALMLGVCVMLAAVLSRQQ